VLPWSPLHGGLLAGILRKQGGSGRSGGGRAAETLAGLRPQVEAYEAFCDEIGEDPAQVGLAWLLHQPAVTAPIVGPSSLGQLDGALRALEIKLDDAALDRLDKIFPGPGGAAPEAYAW
jgi:aryl-alcohol dehydrogenase-like predicted oxidoreductase